MKLLKQIFLIGAVMLLEQFSIPMSESDVDTTEEYYDGLFTNPRYLQALTSLLPFLDARGALDLE